MPRPKKSDGSPVAWDMRLTPISGNPIDFSGISVDDFQMFICCEEGGEGTSKRLHYHAYALTLRSETWLRKIAQALTGGQGNPAYSVKKAHSGSLGYVVKEGKVKVRLGCDDRFLTEMLSKSQEYRKELETERKRVQRSKENTLAEIMKVVAEGVSSRSQPHEVMSAILAQYYLKQVRFPNRGTLENAVMTLLYPHRSDLVDAYYSRNLTGIFFS